MNRNILDYTLNAPLDPVKLIVFVLVFLLLWHLVIKRFWRNSPGPLVTIGIVLMIAIFAILFIASIQVVSAYGLKMLFPLFIFWGIVILFLVQLIKALRK